MICLTFLFCQKFTSLKLTLICLPRYLTLVDLCDRYLYLVTVITGLRNNAGTRSRVGVSLCGDKMETGDRLLSDGVNQVYKPD